MFRNISKYESNLLLKDKIKSKQFLVSNNVLYVELIKKNKAIKEIALTQKSFKVRSLFRKKC